MTIPEGRRPRRWPGTLGALGLAGTLAGILAASSWALPKSGPAAAAGASGSPGTHATTTPAASTATPAAASASAAPASPMAAATPTAVTPTSPPTSVPAPARLPLDLVIGADPERAFAHQLTKTWCAPAAVQMTLAVLGLADISAAFQRRLQERIGEWESREDSRNLRWGPTAMARALDAYGAKGYEVRVYRTRQAALLDAAKAIVRTSSPVILLAWRGAHAWVMTGFRADADPTVVADATILGGYILDPWYPSVSSIWGASDPPGAFQDEAEMIRNYLAWKRPEGRYPDRDGQFVAVVPTIPAGPPE